MSPKRPKRVALYLGVSTSEQTTRNQRRELHAVAERHGWHIVATYEDAGVSGAKGRDERRRFINLRIGPACHRIDTKFSSLTRLANTGILLKRRTSQTAGVYRAYAGTLGRIVS
jgi:hypothetical protein